MNTKPHYQSRPLGWPRSTFPLLAAGMFCLASCATREGAPPAHSGDAARAHLPPPAQDELLARIPATFKFATAQYSFMLDQLRGEQRLPRTYERGQLRLIGPADWTSGFFPGSLWYLYQYTGEVKWREAARDCTERLEAIKDFTGNHDIGFMLFCSYGNGYRLTGDPGYRDLLIHGGRTAITRFDPRVGMIRSWDSGSWKYPVIVDNMMNLELLTWAGREANDPRLTRVAVSHADLTRRHHYRPDYSSYHVVDFDPEAGTVRGKHTHQGAADNSAWARGQAWGLYGFVMMHRETGHPEYREQAERVALFILRHPRLPSDKIPYWDFDAPGIPNEPRDASSAAIMASALLELSGRSRPDLGREFMGLAREQLLSLSSPAYLADVGENGGFLLKHATGNRPRKSEVDVPLNYADYYFLEALLRYSKLAGHR